MLLEFGVKGRCTPSKIKFQTDANCYFVSNSPEINIYKDPLNSSIEQKSISLREGCITLLEIERPLKSIFVKKYASKEQLNKENIDMTTIVKVRKFFIAIVKRLYM